MLYCTPRLGSLFQDLENFAFRRTAFGLTAAAAMFAASAMTQPSFAQQVSANGYSGTPACAPYKGTDKAIVCEIEQSRLRTKAAQGRAAEAQKQIDAANKELKSIAASEVCFDFLKKGRDEKRFTRDAVLEAATGKLTIENACAVARKFGFGQRASADGPRGQ